VNAPLKTAPQASSKHDALILDVGSRITALGRQITEAVTMSPEDQADLFGRIQDQINHEYMRLGGCREMAAENAATEAAEEAESRWNEQRSAVAP